MQVGLIPKRRIIRIWNGLPVQEYPEGDGQDVRDLLGMDSDRIVVGCACRANRVKGVHHLLRAFDVAMKDWPAGSSRPALVYIGDGPQLANLEALRNSLDTREDIFLTGYRPEASTLLAGVDLCVVPSLWQDAFPLSVMEAMSLGKPVIASKVGGIPEMIDDGVTGVLVAPGDERGLAASISRLLGDSFLCERLGRSARQRVVERFAPETQIAQLVSVVLDSPSSNHEVGETLVPSS
jgi:glycosyltransferase involved in cell wall biosynthesis